MRNRLRQYEEDYQCAECDKMVDDYGKMREWIEEVFDQVFEKKGKNNDLFLQAVEEICGYLDIEDRWVTSEMYDKRE